jgi:hypothetical protein
MIELFIKFFSQHKFSLEVATIGLGGITISELAAADYSIKILIGLTTLYLIIMKEVSRRKKRKE